MTDNDSDHLRLLVINLAKALQLAHKDIKQLQQEFTALRDAVAELREPPLDQIFQHYQKRVEILKIEKMQRNPDSTAELLSLTIQRLEQD